MLMYRILSTLFLITILFACGPNRPSVPAFSLADELSGEALEQFEQKIAARLMEYTNPDLDSSIISFGKAHVFVSKELINLYKDAQYQRIWGDSTNRNDLIDIIDAAYYEGLNPSDYHIATIKELMANKQQDEQSEAERLAQIDVLMSDAILLYAFHMVQGKVDPVSLDPHWNYSRQDVPDDIDLLLLARLEERSLKDSVRRVQPAVPMYSEYKKWFVHYDSLLKNNIEIEQLVYPGKSLKLGDTSATVLELKNHLKNFDVSGVSNYDSIFDEELEAALIDFQTHFGLKPDGVAGETTYGALNTTIEERLDMIRVNMERCRWINNLPDDEFLLVNVADFHLYIFRDGDVDYSSRVVVGKEHHETPVFNSKIQYVVFNPTWTIPYSIATKETLPRLKRDPNYLPNRNMTLLRNGVEVDPATVDFSQYSTNNFPFTIRQEPGVYNALGRMKFIFPNKYSVYLHDTPSKSYFAKSERTFSHGCVRVQNPHLLAEELLGEKGYDQDKIKEVLATQKETVVHLKEPLQVLIMYWTCYEDRDNNKMYFYKDVYGRDTKILSELKEDKYVAEKAS